MNLKQQVIHGGIFLVGREGLGIVLSLIGVLIVTRLIGPTNYGLFVGALAIVIFVLGIGRLALDIFLIRNPDEPGKIEYDQAFTLLVIISISLAAILILGAPLMRFWYGDSQFLPPLRVLTLVIPLELMAIPAIAQLERALNFRQIASLELVTQALYVGISITLAVAGFGFWAPVLGYVVSRIWPLVRSYLVTSYRPGLTWHPATIRAMLGYSLGYSVSMWIWELRTLVNPIVVGRYLGPEAVAFVSLAIRFATLLGFVKNAAWRLSIAVLGRVQDDLHRMRTALEEAMSIQVLAVGLPLGGFSLVAPVVVPLLFGEEWLPVLDVYPFVALGLLMNAVFGIQASVLYVKHKNWQVALANTIGVTIFVTGAFIFVPWLGIWGYGLAEIPAMLGYLILHHSLASIFRFTYTQTLPWLLALSPPLFAVFLPIPFGVVLWLPLLIMLAIRPQQRTQIRDYTSYLMDWKAA